MCIWDGRWGETRKMSGEEDEAGATTVTVGVTGKGQQCGPGASIWLRALPASLVMSFDTRREHVVRRGEVGCARTTSQKKACQASWLHNPLLLLTWGGDSRVPEGPKEIRVCMLTTPPPNKISLASAWFIILLVIRKYASDHLPVSWNLSQLTLSEQISHLPLAPYIHFI